MTSIRARLFVILLAATGIAWLSAVVWIQQSTRAQVAEVLDRRLQESAQMVASLIARSGGIVGEGTASLVHAPALPGAAHDFARQLVCQVWGVDGKMKSGSDGAPAVQLADGPQGFSEREVDGVVWRVYSHVDAASGIRVMVGDARFMRDRLVGGVVLGLLAPAVLILPLLAGAIWLAVRGGLAPLDRFAAALARRPATDLRPLDARGAARELQPTIAALNGLFQRLHTARERERSFTVFAAHELKTPLAGLKTQAQIAAIAPDEATRTRALTQLVAGVDRTDRMVRQLLDMSVAESAEASQGTAQDGARILSDVAEGLAGFAQARGVRLRVQAPSGLWRTTQAALLAPALRNLLENAILASPRDATVEAGMDLHEGRIRFCVRDRGPGIAAQDRPHVTDRFYRGAASAPGGGSGLGLAIVAAAMERMGGDLHLSPRDGGGEQAELTLPATA